MCASLRTPAQHDLSQQGDLRHPLELPVPEPPLRSPAADSVLIGDRGKHRSRRRPSRQAWQEHSTMAHSLPPPRWWRVTLRQAVEQSTLLLSSRRQRPLQLLQHHALIRPPRENRLDIRRQQRQPQDPAHVALREFGTATSCSGSAICRVSSIITPATGTIITGCPSGSTSHDSSGRDTVAALPLKIGMSFPGTARACRVPRAA